MAYIGPGAGLALAGSFLAILAAMLSAMLALLFWPFRWAWRAIRGRRARRRALVRRVVVLGLDGLEPSLVDQFLAEGLMPNLDRLRQSGSYARLGTTWPPLSPVAWSSFSTGTNPGKHNVFDFIARNTADYRPMISSVRIRPGKRQLRIGRYRIPLSGSEIRGLRKSRPFWCALGDAGIFSAVLRVPITFPPDHFHGVQLSAMCVPDLRGSQGMFCHFVENGHAGATSEGDVGGERIVVQRNGKGVRARLPGPPNPLRSDHQMADVPLKVVAGKNGAAVLHVDGQRVDLRPGEYTDWVGLTFPLAPMVKVRGICRFYLKRFEPPFEMYCTPVNIDPEKPVMPISHPAVFSTYLARQHGPFATLGLAEDTWSLSESVLDEDAFLQQAYDIDEERQRMFFDMLGRVPRGFVSCVFDAPDRIQHMFWRFHDKEHPARPADEALQAAHQHRLRDLYERMDALVGRTIDALDEDTTLFVMSDHGFKSFRRCVDLNAWLLEQGYLALKDDRSTSRHEYLADVDWSRTRAYAIGLAGIYVNQQGREAEGIVSPREAEALAKDIADRLTGLRDPQHDQVAIHQAVARAAVYKGPYTEQAPDVIVGYREGYRVSWDTAIGKCGAGVFSDNTKAWSGDHCIHPELVPGVLFCNRKLDAATANIIDIAPTALELLGVTKPAYMDGKSLLCAGETSSN
ncbi:MAG: nucleotide pyrophosphatase [Planctomycetota bacterium]|nr:MAG: nucleotide pyrophosphatase [Planctomycetota bacterium]